jgi:hypothetical protein
VSDSCRAIFRVVGTAVLALALGLALMMGLAACGGGDSTPTTVEVTPTEVESTDTTAGETTTPEETGAIDPALVGKWYSAAQTETDEFTADGKMIVTDDAGVQNFESAYRAEGGSLFFTMNGSDVTVVYSIEGNVLTLGDPASGEAMKYERVAE